MVIIFLITLNKQSKKDTLICPNSFNTEKEYTESISKWLSEYLKKYPEATEKDIMDARQVMMDENQCEASKFITDTEKASDDFPIKKFSLYDKDYYLDSLNFSEDGDVWIGSFLQGLDSKETGTEVYISFYLKDVYKAGKISAKKEAELFSKRAKDKLLMEPFSITESHQKEPAYFIVSYVTCPEKEMTCGYISIMKFSSIGDNAYSILYLRKIDLSGNEDMKSGAKKLLKEKLKIDSDTYAYEQLDSIKVESAVFDYLTAKTK